MSPRAARLPGSRTAVGSARAAMRVPFERDAVAERVVGRRQVALDVVRQRVHAGRRGHRGRQAERQLRVGEHRLGEDLRREHDALDVRVVLADDDAERPTSLPVPEVVGSATKYGSGRRSGAPADGPRRTRSTSPSCVAITPTTLATSSAAPPPKPITQSAPCARYAAAPAITWRAGRVAERRRRRPTTRARPREAVAELGEQRQRRQGLVGDDQRPRRARARAGAGRPACGRRRRSGSPSERRSWTMSGRARAAKGTPPRRAARRDRGAMLPCRRRSDHMRRQPAGSRQAAPAQRRRRPCARRRRAHRSAARATSPCELASIELSYTLRCESPAGAGMIAARILDRWPGHRGSRDGNSRCHGASSAMLATSCSAPARLTERSADAGRCSSARRQASP